MSENPCKICNDYTHNGDYVCIHAARCRLKFSHRLGIFCHKRRVYSHWPESRIAEVVMAKRVAFDALGDPFEPTLWRPRIDFRKKANDADVEEVSPELESMANLFAGKKVTL